MLLTFPGAEVLEVEVCNWFTAVDDHDYHIDEGLARFLIQHAHPGNMKLL